MSAKRIVIVSHYYPPHIGGIEIVAYNEAKRLVALGNEVTVVTSKTKDDPNSGMQEGVRVIRVPAIGLESKGISFPIFSPSLFFHVWRAVRRADIVHAHDVFYLSSFCAAIAARLLRRPLVITQHVAMVAHPSKLVTLAETLVYKTTGGWMLRRADRVVTINDRVKAFVRTLGVPDNKLLDIHNGVDTDLFRRPSAAQKVRARKALNLPSNAFVVLFVGRFVPKKGFDVMRRAGDSKDFLTVFAGGETEDVPTDNQRFVGRCTQAQLAQLYQAADLFVLPSESEGFPLTAQEAMISGVPTILQYDPGYERYGLNPEQVTFLEQPDAKTLRKAIRILQQDPECRAMMAEQAYEYAKKHFTWERHAALLDEIFGQTAPADDRSDCRILSAQSRRDGAGGTGTG